MRSSMSDAALSHLIRAEPTPPKPLPKMPQNPKFPSYGSFAERIAVEEELRGLLAREKVDDARERPYRHQQAARDYDAGRSPPVDLKSSQARAFLIGRHLGKSPEMAHAHAKELALSPLSPARSIKESLAGTPVPSTPNRPSPVHVPSPLGQRGPLTMPGPLGGGLAPAAAQPLSGPAIYASAPNLPLRGELAAAPASASGMLPGQQRQSQPLPPPPPQLQTQTPPQKGSAAPAPATPGSGGGGAATSGAPAPATPGSGAAPAEEVTEEATDTNEQLAIAYDQKPEMLPAKVIKPHVRCRRSPLYNKLPGTSPNSLRAHKHTGPRLETVDGVQTQEAVKAKAKGSLVMMADGILATRGTLQRREMMTAQQREILGAGLLSPRGKEGKHGHRADSPSDGRRQSTAVKDDSTHGGGNDRRKSTHQQEANRRMSVNAEKEGPPVVGTTNAPRMPDGSIATKVAHGHNKALNQLHSQTCGLEDDMSPTKTSPEKSSSNKGRGGRRASFSFGGGGGDDGKSAMQDKHAGKKDRSVTFGEDDKQGGGGTSKRRGSTRPGAHPFLGGMAQLDPFGDVWQVAKPIDTGLPPAEIDGEQLQGLDTNALVWTEGLSDWLPIGDVPPLSEFPPLPKAVSREQGGADSPTPSGGASSPGPDSQSEKTD